MPAGEKVCTTSYIPGSNVAIASRWRLTIQVNRPTRPGPKGAGEAPRRTAGYASPSTMRTSAIQLRFLRARRDSTSSPSKLAIARRTHDGSTFSSTLTLTIA